MERGRGIKRIKEGDLNSKEIMCCFGSGNARWEVKCTSIQTSSATAREPYIKVGQMDRRKETAKGGLNRQNERDRIYQNGRQGPLSQWKWRTDCDSEPWDWLPLSGSTARVRSLAYWPLLFFRVKGEKRGGRFGNIEVLRRSWSRAHKGGQKGLRRR